VPGRDNIDADQVLSEHHAVKLVPGVSTRIITPAIATRKEHRSRLCDAMRPNALIPSLSISVYNLWFDAGPASNALSNNPLLAVMQVAA
jgi:hypothetical protein